MEEIYDHQGSETLLAEPGFTLEGKIVRDILLAFVLMFAIFGLTVGFVVGMFVTH